MQSIVNLGLDIHSLCIFPMVQGLLPYTCNGHKGDMRILSAKGSYTFPDDTLDTIACDGKWHLFFSDCTNHEEIDIPTLGRIMFTCIRTITHMNDERIGCETLSPTKCRGNLFASFECRNVHRQKKEGRNGPSKLRLFQDNQPETVKRWRPFALLLERTLRPFFDFMRARKPCTFLRLRLLG